MKIVINNCYGGFGLSPLAVKRLAELDEKECYFFTGGIAEKKYTPITLEQAMDDALFFNAFSVPNPKELLQSKDWYEMTDEEKNTHNNLYESIELRHRNIERNDAKLIQVVEELGQKASARCSELVIVEIPDDVKWQIEEYDGQEWVAEEHRTWR